MNYKILFSQTKDLSVLLVEDYEPLRNDMLEMFSDFFNSVEVAVDGSEALKLYEKSINENRRFDLVITDIQMPIMNGVELSKAINNIYSQQQIIVLSAHTDSDYLLTLINMGIAQFITKPIDHKILLDTLFRVSKKINSSEDEFKDMIILELGENYIWDTEKLLLKHENNIVELTRHELFLMQFLVQKYEQILTNENIIQYFYDNSMDINENSIRSLVSKLRKKLPENVISNVYGMGYKFMPLR